MRIDALNVVLSNWITIVGICGLLIVWACWSAIRLDRACRTLRRSLQAARGEIARIEQPALGRNFAGLRNKLCRDPLLRPAWLAFAETVVVPREGPSPPRATIRPEQLFQIGLLDRAGANLRYHAALPGLLVGAGLLVTFLGLSVALANAAGIVTAKATDVRNASLQGLLDAASLKFWTSLVGLACSIVYAFWRSQRLKSVERDVDQFCAFLEERFPLTTAALLQTEANRHLEKQTKLTETLANDLVSSLVPALVEVLRDGLGDHLRALKEAIEKLAARETEPLGDALQNLQELLEKFVAQLQQGSTDQLAAVARELSEAVQGLASLRGSLEGAASRLGAAAETLAGRMEEAAERFEAASARAGAAIAEASTGLSEAARPKASTGSTARSVPRSRRSRTSCRASPSRSNGWSGKSTPISAKRSRALRRPSGNSTR